MQKIIQIYPCLLKLLRKQESVTDGQRDSRYYYIPSLLSQGDKNSPKMPFGFRIVCQIVFGTNQYRHFNKKWQGYTSFMGPNISREMMGHASV